MKQFFFLMILCSAFATTSQAQIDKITVINNSNCTVYYALHGDVSGGGCSGSYKSGVFSLAASGTAIYGDPSTAYISGGMNCSSCTPTQLGVNDFFVFADIYDADPVNCSGTVIDQLGEICTGLPGLNAGYNVNTAAGCSSCGTVSAEWDPVAQTLTFN